MQELLETKCPRERIAIIFNPASGQGDREARRVLLEGLAEGNGLTCGLAETDVSLGAKPLAEEAVADGMQRVLVSGGDGSVTEAAGALAGTDAALAVLPGGTGNLLATNFGIPTDQDAAMQLALTGETQAVDVGRANGEVFLIMAGMGADGRMIRDADREMKNRLGVLAYFVAALRNLRRPRVLYTVTVDGRVFRRHAQTVLVANLGRITGGLELMPGADAQDGQLEVGIVRARRPRDVALLAWRTLIGQRQGADLLEIHRGRHIVIETNRPEPVQLDGNEAGSTTRLEVHVEPGALHLVLPEGPLGGGDSALGLPVPPVAAADWVPLAAGVGTTAVLHLGARVMRGRGKEPGPLLRHPALAGAAVAFGLAWMRQQRRERSASPESSAPAEVERANHPEPETVTKV